MYYVQGTMKNCHINDFVSYNTEKIASFVSYQGYEPIWFYTNKRSHH